MASAGGITLGDLVEAVMHSRQEIYRMSGPPRRLMCFSRIRDMIDGVREETGDCDLQLTELSMLARLKDVFVPSATEWERMKGKA